MAKTIVIAGFGPGISASVAERFGREGFRLALVARNADRLAEAAKAFAAKGIEAAVFPTDLSDPAAARDMIGRVRDKLGPITVLHWNVYSGLAGDLTTADAGALRTLLDVAVTSLLAAVQAALPDLRAQNDSAVLVTNGGLGLSDPAVDDMAVGWGAMGLAVANAAKHKVVRLLATKLRPEGIYVGEVMVLQVVKGTAWDNGSSTLEASTVAAQFWDSYRGRSELSTKVG